MTLVEGEGGGWPISDERRGGYVDLVLTRGREGVKNPENLADVICEQPLGVIAIQENLGNSWEACGW